MQPGSPTDAARRREGKLRSFGRMNRVSQETGSAAYINHVPGGNVGVPNMSQFVGRSAAASSCVRLSLRRLLRRSPPSCLLTFYPSFSLRLAHAVIVRGIVTDPLGKPVAGARVQLIQGQKVVAVAITGLDGTFEIRSPPSRDASFCSPPPRRLLPASARTSTVAQPTRSRRTSCWRAVLSLSGHSHRYRHANAARSRSAPRSL